MEAKKGLDLGSHGSTHGAIGLTRFPRKTKAGEERFAIPGNDADESFGWGFAPPHFKCSKFRFLNQNASVWSPA